MSQLHISNWSRYTAYGVSAAVLVLFGASSANAQWAAKPAPHLPRTVLEQGQSGSVVLDLVFESDGSVKDVRVVRSSGVAGLDEVAREGAMRWRMAPGSLQPSDLTLGRQHMIKFYLNKQVARRIEPFQASWKEL